MANGSKKLLTFGAGALLPAIGFSLTWFCCLPIAAGIAAGVGVAGFGTKLMPLRPVFTGVSLLCLGIAFYQSYRRQPCGTTDCPTPGMRLTQRIVVWFMALMTAALLTLPYWSSWLIYWSA